ncbi:hypothetical protein [Arthrobacter sulfonylureivorans]|uniref:Uncharacterized protein n=1 Tax=Arthrobacter sulfonylureivorans TaxID=2486855 RepID=A0ABY3WD20_9MICC|nr:hypothetical protein [Arthrobacter sulfonylureivorans]UNK47351.1 hypothetical protein MNQ99_08480 [Arthrobacter sulfonylureivorans]
MTVAVNVASEMPTPLGTDLPRMAIWSRKNTGQPVDGERSTVQRREAIYTAVRFTEHLMLEGLTASIGSVGNAYADRVRRARVHAGRFRTIEDVEDATFEGVDWSTTTACTAARYDSPAEYEATYESKNPSPIPEMAAT